MAREARRQLPVLGMLVHARGDLAQPLKRRQQFVLRRLASAHEPRHDGVARVFQFRAAERLDHRAVAGRDRLRRLQPGVAAQRRHPLQLGVDGGIAVIADAMDAQDGLAAALGIVDAIGGVLREVDHCRGRARRQVVEPDRLVGETAEAGQQIVVGERCVHATVGQEALGKLRCPANSVTRATTSPVSTFYLAGAVGLDRCWRRFDSC
jgi:hypothetical protein